MITTTVTAPPLEDSDGVADFLPDLSDRMSEFDNNNIDAEDNFDALGMMETLPTAAKAGAKSGAMDGVKKVTQQEIPAQEGVSESQATCVESSTNADHDANVSNNTSASTEETEKEHSENRLGTKQFVSAETTLTAGADLSPLSPQHSVLRNRKTHTEVTSTGSSSSEASVHTNHVQGGRDSAHSGHGHAGCCGEHSVHSVHSVHSTTHSAVAGSSSSSSSSSSASFSLNTDSSFAKEEEDKEDYDLVDVSEVNEDIINLAQQRLAQNLQQVSVLCTCIVACFSSN